jgi:hypothetical protein
MNDELYAVPCLFEKEPKASNIFLLGRYLSQTWPFHAKRKKENKKKKCVFYFFPNKVRPICV